MELSTGAWVPRGSVLQTHTASPGRLARDRSTEPHVYRDWRVDFPCFV